MKKALITGLTGQDGRYLAELLIQKGYEVHGIVRRTSTDPQYVVQDINGGEHVVLHEGNLRDLNTVSRIMDEVVPDEVYNLAAQSHVGTSFSCPEETWDVNYYGVGRVVNEAVRVNPSVRMYQASTSEMFGNSAPPQKETTPFMPVSPYAEAKLRAHEDFIVGNREQRGVFALSGILFNHESPRRGRQFVTRKITFGFAQFAHGKAGHLELGNLNAKRDWGFAGDYVEAMHRMLQQDVAQEYVVATGESHTVRDFVNATADFYNVVLNWEGEGVHEKGYDQHGNLVVSVNPKWYRPHEVHYLLGDNTRIQNTLGWKPSVTFDGLVKMMAKADYDRVARM